MYVCYIDNKPINIDSIEELILKLYEGAILKSEEIKRAISRYQERIPLYDIKSRKVYLIYQLNVYQRIVYDHYRLLSPDIIENLDTKMKTFMEQYDLNILENTYYKVFYSSFSKNNYLTNCVKPSYKSGFTHINPYYREDELHYLAIDWGLTRDENICETVKKHDITSETLLQHQEYIFQKKSICLVKYYSLFGSYLMNRYLRLNKTNIDPIIEHQIQLMMKLIKKAPPITSASSKRAMYRLIENDSFMAKLLPGDIYTDPSFMSTTRNPFYYQNNYQFGYILIKINIPPEAGIGLCIESYSNFPEEEEVIFPPTSKYRLDNIIVEPPNLERSILNKKVMKKYEMTLLGNEINTIDKIIPAYDNVPIIDMEKLNLQGTTVAEKMENLISLSNKNRHFQSNDVIFTIGSYNSSGVYKKFFYYTTNNGIMIYSSNPKYGNLNLIIEIGNEMHCNYYFKYSINDTSQQVNLDTPQWLKWISFFGKALGISTIIFHPNYAISYDKESVNSTRYVHPINIYQYLKNGKKYFQEIEITPAFEYFILDQLNNTDPSEILNQVDKDELYQIQDSLNISNLCDFYLKIVDSFPQFRITLEEKIGRLFQSEINPFTNLWYRMECWSYLYNRNFIKVLPQPISNKGSFKKVIQETELKQFENRLRNYQL